MDLEIVGKDWVRGTNWGVVGISKVIEAQGEDGGIFSFSFNIALIIDF